MSGGQILGWFISTTEEELAQIKKILKLGGYDEGPKGFKEMFFDLSCVAEEDIEEAKARPDENIAQTINDFVNGNPEAVRKIASGTVNMFGKMLFGGK